jgi:hypothetical protein
MVLRSADSLEILSVLKLYCHCELKMITFHHIRLLFLTMALS